MRALTQRLQGSIVALALASTVVGVGGVVASTVASAAATTMTTTTWVNLRSGPGTEHPVLAVVPPSATVLATGASEGRWLAVEYQGTAGYLSSTYLTPAAQPPAPTSPAPTTPAPTGQAGTATTTADVNVRSGPGTQHAVVAVAARGTAVATTGATSGNWTEVLWADTPRWISSSYLAPAAATPPAATPAPEAPATPAIVGQVRTTVDLNLRTDGQLGAPVWGVLPANSVVDVTGVTTDTYTQILYSGRLLWISTKYTVAVSAGPTAQQPTGVAAQVVAYARAHVGSPYVVGTRGPDTFDCSGLVAAAYGSAGVLVPHSMSTQAATGTRIALADLQPGDAVVWGDPVSAVSIYVGDDQLIIADGPAYGVRQVSLSSRLKWATFAGGRRYTT